MENTLSGTGNDFEAIYNAFAPVVWRVCVMYFGARRADCEDAMQSTFLRLLTAANPPSTPEHTKAWLIVTAGNICKDMLRHSVGKSVSLDMLGEVGVNFEYTEDETLKKVLRLPKSIKTAVYLHYYEDMPAKQIASLLGVSESTVFWQLHKGRKLLKNIIESENKA